MRLTITGDPFSSMSDFQLKRKKKLVSQLSSTDVEFQSYTFETLLWFGFTKKMLVSETFVSFSALIRSF